MSMILKHDNCLLLLRCVYTCQLKVFKQNYSVTSRLSTLKTDNVKVRLDYVYSDINRKKVLVRMINAKRQPHISHVQSERGDKPGLEAAVLVPMCHVNGEPALLFMKRSRYLKTHRGEISFPGGMKDISDRDLTHTALRETFEEVGLQEDQVDVWGTIPPSPTRLQSGGWVTPVLGYCKDISIDQLNLNQSEVEQVFTRTISSLCDPANQRQTQWRYPGYKGFILPVFLCEEHRIWGLTAVILHQVLNLITPELYTFKLKHIS